MNHYHQKLLQFVLAFIFLSHVSYGQLVQNSGFEQGTTPTAQSQLHYATSWTHYRGDCLAYNVNVPNTWASSDLFDKQALNSPSVSVPHNIWTTPAGLDERTGQRRYAGIWSQINDTDTYQKDERIRGSLQNALQAGSYNLSLYLARGKVYLNADYPNLFNVEVVLRQNNSCSVQKIIYTSPSVTNFQWQQYATTFTISAAEANIYNKVEIRLKHYTYSKFGGQNVRTMFIDDVSIEPVVCTLDPSYSYSVGCDKKANQAVINVIGNSSNQNSQWNLYEMSGNSIADQDIISGPNPIQVLQGHNVTFRVPNIAGKYYMIKHGVWTSTCPWVEQRRTILIPTFNDYVNSDFTGTYTSPAGGGAPYIQATASAVNPVSDWLLFSSTYDAPITGNMNGWTFVTIVPNTNTPTFPNLQSGMYYVVRHFSKHNCSDYAYTDKKFYGNGLRTTGNTTLEAIDTHTGKMAKEEYTAFEKLAQQELSNIQNPVKLYPNPASGVVNIAKNSEIGDFKVTITNQYGKPMYEGVLSKDITLTLSGWRKGLYFVNIHTPQGIKTEKLIVE